MQSTLSYTEAYARLDRLNRLLHLQNAATQLELLLKKSRDLEASEKYNKVLSLYDKESTPSTPRGH